VCCGPRNIIHGRTEGKIKEQKVESQDDIGARDLPDLQN
jgi:hypothetical protein